MRKITPILVGVALFLAIFGPARDGPGANAPDVVRVALVLSVGGLGDRSFNDLAYAGLVRAERELGVEGALGEPVDHAEDEAYLAFYAERGYDLVVAVGYLMTSKLERVAPRYPDTEFLLIDGVLDLPNVRSYAFREEEGCFLVGALAALATETGTVGFVGGMKVPLIEKFLAGYAQGARHVRPDLRVLSAWAGSFSDPVTGKAKALRQIREGADVVFQAAGATGNGVIRAAAEEGIYAIGVDANQNDMAPGRVLTSMLKRVEETVFRTARDVVAGEPVGGVRSVGLAEGMLGWALDEHNRAAVTPEMEARLSALEADIVAGRIRVSETLPEAE
ncbi:MAG: BMP family ABC transporter substrate-binding protein [Planctomycetota bacterium]